MKTRHLLALIAAGILLIALVGCSDDDDCPITDPGEPTVAQFAGSTTCMGCHETKYEEWVASGHPYKLTKIEGVSPTESFPAHSFFPNDPVDPPNGLAWSDITYTIGGYGWKMRWIDENGWIVTSGEAADLVQYNFETEAWVTYHTGDEPGTKPYDCGKCHTTGWVANPDPTDLSGNQDGLPGMWGTFLAGGVHCEQCHGMGSLHVDDPSNVDMTIDSSSAACGECHTRDANNRIASSGGWIKHHEQYDEWLHSPHGRNGGPGCNDCHDPHASVAFDAETPGDGMLPGSACTSCHDATEYALHDDHSAMPGCTDCHMPEAAKSATVSADNPYDADVTSHIIAINTDAVNKTDGMFTEDGNFVRTENELAKITLDFACYGCHNDPEGNGGGFSERSLEELSAMAQQIHPNAKKKAQVASR